MLENVAILFFAKSKNNCDHSENLSKFNIFMYVYFFFSLFFLGGGEGLKIYSIHKTHFGALKINYFVPLSKCNIFIIYVFFLSFFFFFFFWEGGGLTNPLFTRQTSVH